MLNPNCSNQIHWTKLIKPCNILFGDGHLRKCVKGSIFLCDLLILLFFFFGSNVLVYKLGGTSLSITVIEVNSGIYRVLATNTDDSIGGVCFTEALAQHLASEFQR